MTEGDCYDKMFIFISKFIPWNLISVIVFWSKAFWEGIMCWGVTLMNGISAFMAETLYNFFFKKSLSTM